MDNKPKVSVIVPLYNAEKYFRATLDSIINQSMKNIEIILVDDGSIDKSIEICNEYADTDKRIKIISRQKTGGVCAARNTGINIAEGEYLGFVDCDDTIDLNMYKEMYELAKKYDADLIDCGYRVILKGNKKTVLHSHEHPKNVLLDRKYLLEKVIPPLVGVKNNPALFIGDPLCNKLYKTEIIKANNIALDESRMKFEDRIFNVEFMHKAENIIFSDKFYYNYIKRANSLLSRPYPYLFDAIFKNQIRYRELFGDYLDFDSPGAIMYRIQAITFVLASILVSQREHEPNVKQKVIAIFKVPEVKKWYAQLQTASGFYKLVKFFILSSRYSLAYFCFEVKFIPLRLRKSGKKMLKGTKPIF